MKKLYWYYPHLNFWMGGTRYLFNLLSRLKNFEKILVSNGGNANIISTFEEQDIQVKQPLQINTNSLIYWALFPVFIFIETIYAFIILQKADIIVATLFPSNLICALSSKLLKKKYFYLCYEPFPFFHNKDFINKQSFIQRILLTILSFLYAGTDIWATKQATAIMTLDKYKKNEIKKIYHVTSHIISIGIDMEHFKPTFDNLLSKKFGSNRKIVMHSTDYSELKRTDLVLKAWSKVVKKVPNALLLISSTQPNSSNKHKYVDIINTLFLNRSVHLLGLVPFNDLPKYYSLAACYVSACTDPIVATNLPVKEAMACGTPAIRSSVALDDVIDGVSGYIVDPEDTKLFSEKIIQILTNGEKQKEMGIRAREYIVNTYSWDKTIRIFNKLISQ